MREERQEENPAATSAMARYVPSESPSLRFGKTAVASVHTIRPKMTSQLQLIPIRIPRIVSRLMEEVTRSA